MLPILWVDPPVGGHGGLGQAQSFTDGAGGGHGREHPLSSEVCGDGVSRWSLISRFPCRRLPCQPLNHYGRPARVTLQ